MPIVKATVWNGEEYVEVEIELTPEQYHKIAGISANQFSIAKPNALAKENLFDGKIHFERSTYDIRLSNEEAAELIRKELDRLGKED